MSAADRPRRGLGFLALIVVLGAGQSASSQQNALPSDPAADPSGATPVTQAPPPTAKVAAAPPPSTAAAEAPATGPAPSGTAATGSAAAGQAADPALAAAMEVGHTEYLKNCRACHGSKGTAGVPLAGNYKVEGGFGYLGWAILTGPGYMPEFAEALTDEQIAQICTYILNSWGNSYGIVTAADIASLR